MAEIVGCSHVTVSRKLSKLSDKGLIEKRGQEITVPDKSELKEEAMGSSYG